MKFFKIFLVFFISTAYSQTQIDYRTQVKNKPIISGSILPSACVVVGDQFFLTPPGQWYQCASSLTYTPIPNPVPDSMFSGSTVAQRQANCGPTPIHIVIPATETSDTTMALNIPQDCVVTDYRLNVSYVNGAPAAGVKNYEQNYIFNPSPTQVQNQTGWGWTSTWITGGLNHDNGPKSNLQTGGFGNVSETRGQSEALGCSMIKGGFGDSVCLIGGTSQFGGAAEKGGDGQIGIDMYNNIGADITGVASTNEFKGKITAINGNTISYTLANGYESWRGEDRIIFDTNIPPVNVTVTSIAGTPPVVTGSGFAAALCGGATPCTPATKFFTLQTSCANDLVSTPYPGYSSGQLSSATLPFTPSSLNPTGPTFINITGGTGWTPGFYLVTVSNSGYLLTSSPPASPTSTVTGGQFCVGGNIFSGLNFMLQIANVASDTSMTLVSIAQGANSTWHGDFASGTGQIFTGSTVTALNAMIGTVGSLVVANATPFNIGDTFQMPLGNNISLIGMKLVDWANNAYWQGIGILNASAASRPLSYLIYNGGSSMNGMAFATNPYNGGITFAAGYSPQNGYLLTTDTMPNSIAKMISVYRSNNYPGYFAYNKNRDAFETSPGANTTGLANYGGLYGWHTYITSSVSPYTVKATDNYITCDSSTANVTIILPSLATTQLGGDGQEIRITKQSYTGNSCIVQAASGDKIGYGNGSIPSYTITVHGQVINLHGSNQAARTWEFNSPPDPSMLPAGGTPFTISGACGTISNILGGSTAGQFQTTGSGGCTATVFMGQSTSAPNGWACYFNDMTTVTNKLAQTSTTTGSAGFAGNITSGDIINFSCQGY